MRPLLDGKGACAVLCIGSRKLWELTNRGEIPHLRIGRAVRYDPSDLEAWIEAQKKRATGARVGERAQSRSPSADRDGDQHRRDEGRVG